MPPDAINRLEQFRIRVGFQHVSERSAAQHFARKLLGKMHAQNQHLGFRRTLPHGRRDLQAVHLRHGQVQQEEIRLALFHQVHGGEAVGGLATNFDAALRFQHCPQPAPYHGVIVRHEHSIRPGISGG